MDWTLLQLAPLHVFHTHKSRSRSELWERWSGAAVINCVVYRQKYCVPRPSDSCLFISFFVPYCDSENAWRVERVTASRIRTGRSEVRIFLSSKTPRPWLRPPQPSIQWVSRLFPEGKAVGGGEWFYYSPPSRPKVKCEYSCTSCLPRTPLRHAQGQIDPFTVHT